MSDELKDKPAGEYQTAPFQSPYAALADELWRRRILDAREMSPEEKLLAGEELFEWACSITLAGIRNQNPDMSEAECRQELEARLAWRERRERDDVH